MDEKKNAYDIREIFEELELQLIASMKRNLKSHKNQEIEEGFRWEMWQAAKLRGLRAYQRENREIMNAYRPLIKQNIRSRLVDAWNRGVRLFGKVWQSAKHRLGQSQSGGAIALPRDIKPKTPGRVRAITKIPKEKDFFGTNDKKLMALVDSVTSDFAKVENSTLRKMDDIYRQTVYKAQMSVAAGAKTLDQAIDMATMDFLTKGIQSIRYRNGHNISIASYAEMAIRTANHRAMLMGEGKKRDEMGIHTVFVSAHASTCELCRPWQGRKLIDDVFSSGTKEEAEEMGYPLVSEAIAAGLLHPNCRHHLATYFQGITQIPEIPEDSIIKQNYSAEQRQRRIEGQIRRWKRMQAGALDPEQYSKATMNLKRSQSQMRKHLEEHPELRRQYNREKNRLSNANNLKIKQKILAPQLSAAETGAVKRYISSESYKINEALRSGEPLSKTEINFVAHLDGAINKLPKYNGTLYRSVTFYNQEDFTAFLESHRIGQTVRYPAYTSASKTIYNPDDSLRIKILNVSSGADLGAFNPEEKEVLYKHGQLFKVIDVYTEEGKPFIVMEESNE
ncbi:phage minor capsid protein [Eubacterium barkeri]|uniref:ADP-ribosyltransferase exoenzyme n=1 Tax=Eubacterium barkeri TaxID=1528 RepID=A0A1H3HE13_EUBBA|nr:phage minor capsid protein [Eubacterium barkeri]SDY13465.1 ADP-ribosyltransferase exoenzyme [Eubacterium barkeri]